MVGRGVARRQRGLSARATAVPLVAAGTRWYSRDFGYGLEDTAMVQVLEELIDVRASRPVAPPHAPDERAARRTLRQQVAKLERDLAQAVADARPGDEVDWSIGSRGGPRLLTMGELEQLRDQLADRVAQATAVRAERLEVIRENRLVLERMLLEPGKYKYVRLYRQDVGERGCGAYHVRPRLGIVGMLMGWWQVKVSSGCPLAGGGPRRTAALPSC